MPGLHDDSVTNVHQSALKLVVTGKCELEKMWKEVLVDSLKVASRNLLEEAEKNDKE